MKFKKITFLAIFSFMFVFTSCNEYYDEEQYTHYVSLKAPSNTVYNVRVKYHKDEKSLYRQPILISGSTDNDKNIKVNIGIDLDTLEIYNKEHYFDREDLYYKPLSERHYEIPESVIEIPAGQNQGLMDIYLDFNDLDLVYDYILPLRVNESEDGSYMPNPNLGLHNALLRIIPFNDYSGIYSTTSLSIYTEGTNLPIVAQQRDAKVVNENTVFFYAGAVDEKRVDRRRFKIFATFIPTTETTGTVLLESEDPEINFKLLDYPYYEITNVYDATRPYLLRRTIIIRDVNYSFEDKWEVEGLTFKYNVSGTMSMQRNINTTIPDEEFAIEW